MSTKNVKIGNIYLRKGLGEGKQAILTGKETPVTKWTITEVNGIQFNMVQIVLLSNQYSMVNLNKDNIDL